MSESRAEEEEEIVVSPLLFLLTDRQRDRNE